MVALVLPAVPAAAPDAAARERLPPIGSAAAVSQPGAATATVEVQISGAPAADRLTDAPPVGGAATGTRPVGSATASATSSGAPPAERVATLVPPPRRAGGAPTSGQLPLGSPLSETDAQAMQAALDRARAAYRVTGVEAAVVALDGGGWSGASGTDTRGGPALDPRTPLVIGSIAKTFTAAAVLQLAEGGRIRLGNPVTDYLPEVAGLAGNATVKQLLNHTSAIPDFYHRRSRSHLNGGGLTHDEVLGFVGRSRLRQGRDYAYSNTNYLLLAMLVERITGRAFAEEIADRFTVPLGLDDTAVHDGASPGDRLTPGWASAFWGSGSMTSTARDVARWGQALYSGELLSQATIREMASFHTKGYGLGAQRFNVRDNTAIGHTGLLAGETSILLWLPTQRVAIALIANDPNVKVMGMLQHRDREQPSLIDLAWALGG